MFSQLDAGRFLNGSSYALPGLPRSARQGMSHRMKEPVCVFIAGARYNNGVCEDCTWGIDPPQMDASSVAVNDCTPCHT